MKTFEVFGVTISVWMYVPVAYFLWVTLLLFVKRIVFKAIHQFAQRTKTQLDNIFISAADLPVTLLIFTSGGVLMENILPVMSGQELTNYFLIGFKVTTILAIVLFIDKFVTGLIREYSHRIEILRSTGGVAQGIVRVVVLCLGLLILLDSFGVSITPVIASLGIGSLAVALALQPTLENLFSGIQLIADKPIQVGQFIKLESGEEGYVYKIGWRSTWVRMLPNNTVIIPNKMLINAKILNYYYPETELAVLVQVGVHYNSDLEHVERVTIDVARETLREVAGGVASFDPFIRYHTFDDFSINFTVILRAKEFVDHFFVKHEFIKRLHKRYNKEGIVIPYPIRATNYEQEKAFETPSPVKKG